MARRRGHAFLHAALGALVFVLLAAAFVLDDTLPASGMSAGPGSQAPKD